MAERWQYSPEDLAYALQKAAETSPPGVSSWPTTSAGARRDTRMTNGGKKPHGSDENRGLTIDGQTGEPDPTPRRIDLSTLKDVRLELAYLYRQIDAGKIPSQDGTRRAYVLRQIADVITITELERRLEELEERHASRGLLPNQVPARMN
jgi:hypothetical protein